MRLSEAVYICPISSLLTISHFLSSSPQFQYSCGRGSVIWEVSDDAKKGEASTRVEQLAQHKEEMSAFKDKEQR